MDPRRQGRRATVLAAGLLLSACASPARPTSRSFDPIPETVTLHVENNYWTDVTVYAVRVGVRSRIGTVGSLGQRDFHLGAPTLSTGRVQLYAEPVAGDIGYHAPEISLAASGRVDLIVENQLALSKVLLSPR
jgi:hypothetical protein